MGDRISLCSSGCPRTMLTRLASNSQTSICLPLPPESWDQRWVPLPPNLKQASIVVLFKTWFLYVALAVLELTFQTRRPPTQRSDCLSAVINGVHQHHPSETFLKPSLYLTRPGLQALEPSSIILVILVIGYLRSLRLARLHEILSQERKETHLSPCRLV